MKLSYKKDVPARAGFTLIELLVVIAIIGVLSSVVIGSVNKARDKGGNAAVKADLNGVRSQAEIFYDNNGLSYVGLCADPLVVKAVEHAILLSLDTGTVATRCNETADAWAINTLLKVAEGSDAYWCIDSLGNGKGEPTELAGATICS